MIADELSFFTRSRVGLRAKLAYPTIICRTGIPKRIGIS